MKEIDFTFIKFVIEHNIRDYLIMTLVGIDKNRVVGAKEVRIDENNYLESFEVKVPDRDIWDKEQAFLTFFTPEGNIHYRVREPLESGDTIKVNSISSNPNITFENIYQQEE